MGAQKQTLLAVSAALALGACTAENSTLFTSWNQPAGAFIDEGQFGNPTMQNMMAQKCAGRAKGYIVPDPVVVLDPTSPKSPQVAAPVYYRGYIRCSGHLNGKYAQVIFQEYVESATQERADSTAAETELTATGG
jgi:hypothetical protein